MSLSATAWVALSIADDAALLALYALRKRSATFSDRVVPTVNSLKGNIMASKTNTVASDEAQLAQLIETIKAARGTKKPVGSIVDKLADMAADSGRSLSRIGAGFAASVENGALSFAAERDRQTRRTAEHLLALARK